MAGEPRGEHLIYVEAERSLRGHAAVGRMLLHQGVAESGVVRRAVVTALGLQVSGREFRGETVGTACR